MDTVQGKSPIGLGSGFGWIFFLVTVLPTAVVGAAGFVGLRWASAGVTRLGQDLGGIADGGEFKNQLVRITENFWFQGFPLILGFFLLVSLLLWLLLRRGPGGPIHEKAVSTPKTPREKLSCPAIDPRVEERVRGRLFLHVLSLLQRDGRLVDFLNEDLSPYDDAQVGAAVRSIHANCRKAIERQVSLKPVMDQPEESDVTIPADFDPVSVKLTGNVTGSPPFKGILRHRGWRAGRLELPTLSGDPDPHIVAPAEVEIP